jgi:hypothetical protein
MNRLIPPSTDFRAVRDGRNAQIFYIDVALDNARSVAAGTALVLNVAGNSFYCDANPLDGNCSIHFQDTNFDKGPLPLYVSPGTIFNIPFTQILLENGAQAGKRVRLAYGIDVDFQPGSVSQIAVTNAGGFTSIRAEASTGNYKATAAMAANVAEAIFAPASNPNGAIILSAGFMDAVAGQAPIVTLIAKNAAPASVIDGEVFANTQAYGPNGANFYSSFLMPNVQFVAPTLGLYMISSLATAGNGSRHCRYKLL